MCYVLTIAHLGIFYPTAYRIEFISYSSNLFLLPKILSQITLKLFWQSVMTRTSGAGMYVPVELRMDYADPHKISLTPSVHGVFCSHWVLGKIWKAWETMRHCGSAQDHEVSKSTTVPMVTEITSTDLTKAFDSSSLLFLTLEQSWRS